MVRESWLLGPFWFSGFSSNADSNPQFRGIRPKEITICSFKYSLSTTLVPLDKHHQE